MPTSQPLPISGIPLQEDSQLANRGATITRKRKSIDDTSNHLGESIVIRNATGTPIHELKPKLIVPRAALPLGYIKFSSLSETSRPFTFAAKIWSLENKIDDADALPSILIVQDGRDALAAVERVTKGVYTLHWLAEWVSLEDLGREPAKKCRMELVSHQQSPLATDQWWQSAAVKAPTTKQAEPNALLDFVLADKPRVRVVQTKTQTDDHEKPNTPVLLSSTETDIVAETTAEPIDWTVQIRKHYLEALYASRAPLAYFVKGPLSRARLTYQSHGDEKSLADILRSNILPIKVRSNTVVIDKKYGKAVVDVINGHAHSTELEENGGAVGPSPDRMAKFKRRRKITAEGLLPGEEEHIISWWIKRESSSTHEGQEAEREQRLKRGILEQKFRETQLQIILLMEAMALEAQNLSSDPASKPDTQDCQPEQPIVKEKKPLDLRRMLNTLVEKLQIWETMNEDMVTFSDTSRGELSKNSGSCLRTFCSDIVLPFYMSRLPDVSKDFCYKFGVRLAAEKKNVRPTVMDKNDKNKPGEALKKHPKRKLLDRVLSDEPARSTRKPAGLSRSATDSLVPLIKEEFDEVSLAKIPTARQSIPQSKFYSRREVDLTAEVKATEAKLKRKAEIEQQLKGAIFALKKPNARLAVKEFVDASEQRNGPRKSKPRKPQNPMRNASAIGVQVTATPRVRRHKSLADETIETHKEAEPEIVPPSSLNSIPSSNRKPLGRSLTVPNGPFVFSTPSKASRTTKPSKNCAIKAIPKDYFSLPAIPGKDITTPFTPFTDDPGSEPELPVMVSTPLQRPALQRLSSLNIVVATPLKQTSLKWTSESTSEDNRNAVFTDPTGEIPSSSHGIQPVSSPLQTRQLTKEKTLEPENKPPTDETSIYDVLGWDNDFLV